MASDAARAKALGQIEQCLLGMQKDPESNYWPSIRKALDAFAAEQTAWSNAEIGRLRNELAGVSGTVLAQYRERADALEEQTAALRAAHATLEEYYREAVAALRVYLQNDTNDAPYQFLMQPGESITKLGPSRLVEHFEQQLPALREALENETLQTAALRALVGSSYAEHMKWMHEYGKQECSCADWSGIRALLADAGQHAEESR